MTPEARERRRCAKIAEQWAQAFHARRQGVDHVARLELQGAEAAAYKIAAAIREEN